MPIGSRAPRTCLGRAQLPIEDLFFHLGEPYARKSCTYGSEGGHPSIKNIFLPYATPPSGLRTTTCLSLWVRRSVGPEVRKHLQTGDLLLWLYERSGESRKWLDDFRARRLEGEANRRAVGFESRALWALKLKSLCPQARSARQKGEGLCYRAGGPPPTN